MKIKRNKAKQLLAECEFKQLQEYEKLEILESVYLQYDNEDDIREDIANDIFPKVEEKIIKLLVNNECPIIPIDQDFMPIFLDYLIGGLYYVKNEYIENKLKKFGFDYQVEGKIEKAGMCPCCEYLSIGYGEDGLCDICHVCFWENFGDGPNHMTLEEAKINFKKLGAIDERSLEFIDPEGQLKYLKK